MEKFNTLETAACMQEIKNQQFGGERPLFKVLDKQLINIGFLEGESALKECNNLKIESCNFYGKYPLWHGEGIVIEDSFFASQSRAAIWHTNVISIYNSKIDSMKVLRDSTGIAIFNTTINTDEALWNCKNIELSGCEINGDYSFLNSERITINNSGFSGEYCFQYSNEVIIRDSEIRSKDVFWNTENVTIYNSVIEGMYIGWYSKNLKLINCKIVGTQPFCYCENLILENCGMVNTDLCFEYSSVNATVNTVIGSIKNPKSGKIRAKGINTIIQDDLNVNHLDTIIITNN